HEHCVGLDAVEHVLPLAATFTTREGGALEDTGLAGMVGLAEIAGDAGVDVRTVRHGAPPSVLLGDHRAATLVHRPEGLFRRDGRQQLVVVPWTLGLG